MKLLVIRFFNINSLKGKHEILFEEDPLRSSGLFAITGATGAGKSTILDVITLALYNYIPRLGKVSKSGIEKMGSIVTHFTEEAWAEVEYEAQGQKFMSRWSISKTRNDTFRDYDMDIVRLPEQESLGLKRSEIPDKNAAIIGLNVDQFMKSIILSQGDFSRFLQAKKEDRTKLLQEITGTKIYQDIGRMAFEMVRDKNAEIKLLESKKDGVGVIPEDSVAELKEELKAVSEKIEATEKSQRIVHTILQLFEQEERVYKSGKEIALKEERLVVKEQLFDKVKPLLERHNEAKEYESHISKYEHLIHEKNRLQDELIETKKIEKKASEIIVQSIDEASALTGSTCTVSSIYNALVDFQQLINSLDNSLNQSKNQGVIIRNTIQKFQQNSSTIWVKSLQKTISPSEAITKITKRLSEINVETDISFAELQTTWTEKQKRLNVTKVYKESYYAMKVSREELLKETKWLERATENELAMQKAYDLVAQHEIALEKKLKHVKSQQEKLARNSQLEAFSHLVEEDKPCPLCGSMHHPAVLHNSLSELEKIDLQVAKLDRQHKSAELETKQHLKDLTASKLSITVKQKEIFTLENQLATKKEHLDQQKKEHSWLLTIADEKWDNAILDYTKDIAELDEKIKNFQESEALHYLNTKYSELQAIAATYLLKNSERNVLYNGSTIGADTDVIQHNFTKAISTQENAISTIQKFDASIIKNNSLIDSTRKQLSRIMEKNGLSNPLKTRELLLEKTQFREIVELREDIISKKSSLRTLRETWEKLNHSYVEAKSKLSEKHLLGTYKNSSKAQQEAVKKELSSSLQELHKELGIKGEKIAANNKALTHIKSLEEQILSMRQASNTWILLNEIIGDSKGKKFANFAQNLTLMHLLNRANARLASLTDRYTLSFKPDEDDLLIVDRYQGDTLRAVKTLSGGETFIISLALALSLSDFAAQSIQLESLFIDEGFGTLDQETLDLAMTTLEKLQHNSGKRIGIISHVESLKERIQTQIVVQKNARGYSSLAVIPK